MHRNLGMFGPLVALAIAGCGRSLPETTPVEGRVTFDGKPITSGTIMFFPTKGRPATGAIGADGGYRLTTFQPDDGALPGTHTVTIEASEVIGGSVPQSFEAEIKQGGPPVGQVRMIVPPKYSNRNTSGLTAMVQVQPEPNRVDFDLHK